MKGQKEKVAGSGMKLLEQWTGNFAEETKKKDCTLVMWKEELTWQ